MGDIYRWTVGTVAFLVWIIPFILYLYYPIYAIKRKQKEIYISRMHHPLLIFMALLELYFLFFFHGGGLFHKDVMLFAGSLPNPIFDPLFESFGDLGVLMAILYPLGLLIIWIGLIEGYFPYYVEPLSKDTKKIPCTKAESKQSYYL